MQKVFLLLVYAYIAIFLLPVFAHGQGTTRALTCRGGAGISIKIDKDPSPDDPRNVRAVIRYQKATQVDAQFGNLPPGACSWNPGNFPNVPLEPGYVYFDIPKEAQPWSASGTKMIDTSINGAIYFPDMVSLPRYLSDPSKYWIFYVNTTTNFSNSFGATKNAPGVPVLTKIAGTATRSSELVCRGGPSLGFNQGATVGDNEVQMQLTYELSTKRPGPTGTGLNPGTCALVNPVGIVKPPGQIRFTTSGNAQLSQIKRGDAVDRSPTAAEHWPDSHTIPVYMSDPNHFWIFRTMTDDLSSAASHGSWKPSILDVITSKSPKDISTKRSEPLGPGIKDSRDGVSKSSVVGKIQNLEFIAVNRTLDAFKIEFKARKNASPQVHYSTSEPLREPSTGRLYFPDAGHISGGGVDQIGGFQAEVSTEKLLPLSSGAEFVGRPRLSPERGTKYYFIIRVPKDVNGSEEQYTGHFTTISLLVRVMLSSVEILKEPKHFDSKWSWTLFSADGPSEVDGNATKNILELQNASDRIRMIVEASAFIDSRVIEPDADKTEWEMIPKPGMYLGLIKHEFNTRFLKISKQYPFSFTSDNGMDVVFSVSGYIQVLQK